MTGIRQLGGVVLPAVTVGQGEESRSQAQSLAQTGRLGSDETTVDQLTTEAPGTEIRGSYDVTSGIPADRVPMLAGEFDELVGAGRGPLPLFDTDDSATFSRRGFYSISDGSVDPVHPTRPDVQQYRLTLERAGTRRDSFRAVALNSVDITTPFSGSDPAGVYVPAAAGKTMWLDRADETAQSASSLATTGSSRGIVARYAPPAGLDRPALVYDIPEPADVRGVVVFDSRGNADKFDGDGVRQWQAVYQSGHEFEGDIVLSSDRLRLRIREGSGGQVTAERYAGGSWSAVGLSSSPWYVLDVDLLQLGQHRAAAQLRFRQSGAADYVVSVALNYGREVAIVQPAADESDPIPPDIESLLAPIASGRSTDPQPSRTLVSREVTRR